MVTASICAARRVVVVNNVLTGAADKAASVGEESEALFVSNHFGDSAIGVAVKDLSTAYLYHNRFEANRRDVRAYLNEATLLWRGPGGVRGGRPRGRRTCRSTSTNGPR